MPEIVVLFLVTEHRSTAQRLSGIFLLHCPSNWFSLRLCPEVRAVNAQLQLVRQIMSDDRSGGGRRSWGDRGEERAGGEHTCRAGPVRSVEGWVVFATGLHPEATENDVTEAFSEVGQVKMVRMNFDRRTAESKGYALVEYEEQSEAQDAINRLHGVSLLGKKISVHWAFVRPTAHNS